MKSSTRIKALARLVLAVFVIAVLASCSRGYGCYYGSNDELQKANKEPVSIQKEVLTADRACATI
jgi:hypothetical protein